MNICTQLEVFQAWPTRGEAKRMIVDCHVHIWESTRQLGRCAEPGRLGPYSSAAKSASIHDMEAGSSPVDVCFVLGFRSVAMGADIPNKFIADCVQRYPNKVIGFGSVDPEHDDVLLEAERIRTDYRLAGFVLSPSGQGFHPTSTHVTRLYEYARAHQMPIIIHCGPPFGGPFCEFSEPVLWSSVVREYGSVKFVFTDMGWPWTDQAMLMAAEYENVYIDLAGVATRTWIAYQTLIKAYQLGLTGKLLLGSDFPSAGAAAAIESMYNINQLATATNLPTIPRQKLREIVESNALACLGLEQVPAKRDVAGHASRVG
jgi:hypothetical protein